MGHGKAAPALRTAGLALAGVLCGAVLFAAGYEALGHWRHQRWKAQRDLDTSIERISVASSNPILVWEYRPHGSYTRPGIPLIETNEWGFRDRARSHGKPEGVHRVGFVGDSVTLGLGVSERETFVRRFALRAVVPGGAERLEVLNFGVDGYDAVQVGELLREKVLAFSPDQVIYALHPNDFDFLIASGEKRRYFRKPRSFLVETLRRAGPGLHDSSYYHGQFTRSRKAVFASVRAMRDMAQGRGAAFGVAILPVFPLGLGDFASYPLIDINRWLARFLEEEQIPHVDLVREMAARGAAPSDMRLDEFHPSAAGHAVIATILVEWAARGFTVP